jgi:hypothetical protein
VHFGGRHRTQGGIWKLRMIADRGAASLLINRSLPMLARHRARFPSATVHGINRYHCARAAAIRVDVAVQAVVDSEREDIPAAHRKKLGSPPGPCPTADPGRVPRIVELCRVGAFAR